MKVVGSCGPQAPGKTSVLSSGSSVVCVPGLDSKRERVSGCVCSMLVCLRHLEVTSCLTCSSQSLSARRSGATC